MPDPLRKVQMGDKMPRSVTAYNAMIDAAVAEKNRRLDLAAGPGVVARQSSHIKIVNNTGSDLDRFAVVGLDVPIFTPDDSLDAFHREKGFYGVTPEQPKHLGRFAILDEPAADGDIVRAWVMGVVDVLVDVIDELDTCADIIDGETGHLASTGHGAAQILWKQSDDPYSGYGAGVQWARVRLGRWSLTNAVAKVTTEITKATSATVMGVGTIQRYTSLDSTTKTILDLTGDDEVCYSINRDKKFAVNSTIYVEKRCGVWFAGNPARCADLI